METAQEPGGATVTTQEIIERLLDIHEEMNPDTISESAFESAWSQGYTHPCGCSICQLIQDLTIQMIQEEQP